MSETPRDLGFRMPAEWEPQEAIWLSWPHNRDTWPGAFEPVPGVFTEITREIAESQLVRINIADQTVAADVHRLLDSGGVTMGNICFHLNPTNDCWVRDHGPIYVINENRDQRAILNWEYNSWGEKYPPFDLDNDVPQRIAEVFNEHRFDPGIVLEGGSIDVNGTGTLLTTTSCLLNPNRNPELSQSEIEEILSQYLNVNHFLWLGDGIVGDDTDGHIDDITRFTDEQTIVTVIEDDPNDDNYKPLQENRELLKSFRTEQGEPYKVVELPMPDPVFHESHRLPASYANFLITNDKVLVPTYRCSRDAEACEILQGLFPSRRIVGIDCTDLVWGLGAIHCASQQQPKLGSI